MINKKHENPEFQVVRLNEANAKFYAASGGNYEVKGVQTGTAPTYQTGSANSYGKSGANEWF